MANSVRRFTAIATTALLAITGVVAFGIAPASAATTVTVGSVAQLNDAIADSTVTDISIEGTVDAEDVDYTIDRNLNFTIPGDAQSSLDVGALTISEGATVSMNVEIRIWGELLNDGTITNNGGSNFSIYGGGTNNGSLTVTSIGVEETFTNSGSITTQMLLAWGTVENTGTIDTLEGGSVYFVGEGSSNTGSITTTDQVQLSNGFVNSGVITTPSVTGSGSVSNLGSIASPSVAVGPDELVITGNNFVVTFVADTTTTTRVYAPSLSDADLAFPTLAPTSPYFGGTWNLAASGWGTPVTVDTALTADVTFYAAIAHITVHVTTAEEYADAIANPAVGTIVVDGVIETQDTTTLSHDLTITIGDDARLAVFTLNIPLGVTLTVTGDFHVGHLTNAGVLDVESVQIVFPSTNSGTITGTVTFFEAGTLSGNVFVVTFDLNGATGTPTVLTVYAASLDAAGEAFPTAPTLGTKAFLGWNTAADGSEPFWQTSTAFTADVTLYATFVADFADVPTAHPFYSEINWMFADGIATGTPQQTGAALFRPSEAVSRQAMAAFLYRLSGDDFVAPAEPSFADIQPTDGFYLEIEWMASKGIATGTPQPLGGKPVFKATAPVSRQAMALFLSRYAQVQLTTPTEQVFADVPLDSPYAPAITWMATAGLSNGTAQPTGLPLYLPTDAVSRQAVSAFLYRLTHQL